MIFIQTLKRCLEWILHQAYLPPMLWVPSKGEGGIRGGKRRGYSSINPSRLLKRGRGKCEPTTNGRESKGLSRYPDLFIETESFTIHKRHADGRLTDLSTPCRGRSPFF